MIRNNTLSVLVGRRFGTAGTGARLLAAWTLFVSAVAAFGATESGLKVVRWTPTTPAEASSSIEIEFDRPMVNFGRRHVNLDSVRVSIEPEVLCDWRWIGDRTLLCEIDPGNSLVPATRYSVRLQPGVTSLDGHKLVRDAQHEFVTHVVELEGVSIHSYETPTKPTINVQFSQAVRRSDVTERVFVRVIKNGALTGKGSKVPVVAQPTWHREILVKLDGSWRTKSFSSFFETERAEGEHRSYYVPRASEHGDPIGFAHLALARWEIAPATPLPEDAAFVVVADKVPSVFGEEVRPRESRSAIFRTLPPFEFLGVQCTAPSGDRVEHSADQGGLGDSPDRSCDSLHWVYLKFTSPVLPSVLARGVEARAGSERLKLRKGYMERDAASATHRLTHFKRSFGSMRVPWKIGPNMQVSLVAASASDVDAGQEDQQAEDLRDIYGRRLQGSLNIEFSTPHLRPWVQLGGRSSRFAALELETDSDVPVLSMNMPEILVSLRTLDVGWSVRHQQVAIEPDPAQDIVRFTPLGVRELLAGASGVFWASSWPSQDGRSHRLFGQVTPYHVHAKVGQFRTLVWVTDLKSGTGVPNANVEWLDVSLDSLALKPSGSIAFTDHAGIAVLPGVLDLDGGNGWYFWRYGRRSVDVAAVRVTGPKGIALLPLARPFKTGAWGGRIPNFRAPFAEFGYVEAWGTTAQGVYRRGDVVQYKLYLRDRDGRRLTPPPAGQYKLSVVNPLREQVHETEFELNEFGAHHGEFLLSQSAPMGWHRFVVSPKVSSDRESADPHGRDRESARPTWTAMRMFVTDFRPAPFRVSTDLDQASYVHGDGVVARTESLLHSGGAYMGAEAQIAIQLQERQFTTKSTPTAGFAFSTRDQRPAWTLGTGRGPTNSNGEFTLAVESPPDPPAFGKIWATATVVDDRGRDVYSKSSEAAFHGVERYVGLKTSGWHFVAGKEALATAMAVNRRGEPVADVALTIKVLRRTTNTARIQSLDQSYKRRDTEHWEEVRLCESDSASERLECRYVPQRAGLIRVTASCADDRLRCSVVKRVMSVVGPGRVLWSGRSGKRMSMEFGGQSLDVGDTAEILVKNPLPGAQALVTVERYGVLDHWTEQFDDSAELLSIPIVPDYLPGVHASVVLTVPRAEGTAAVSVSEIGPVDLGKPDYRWGTVEIPVASDHRRLAVDVVPRRSNYKPREKVRVRLRARAIHRAKEKEPVEFAVAVLDEGVLDLLPKGEAYFDPYEGFNKLRARGVHDYNLLTQILGRQEIKNKGATSGGDGGGALDLRSVSRFVGYWNPSIAADGRGRAKFEFTLPDNITGWRVLALASTPTRRFGLGQGSFVASVPTQVRPATPNQVHSGDAFDAEFVVTNRMNRPREVGVTVSASGDLKGESLTQTSTVRLDAGGRAKVSVPVVAKELPLSPNGTSNGAIRFEVRATDRHDRDGLTHSVPVRELRRRETLVDYGSVESSELSKTIEFPSGAVPGSTRLTLRVSPTVVGDLSTEFIRMRDYPWLCTEQRMSRAIFAAHVAAMGSRIASSSLWDSPEQEAAMLLRSMESSQAPNGGIVYWLPVDWRVDPYLSAYVALGLSRLEELGHQVPKRLKERLAGYLQKMLRMGEFPEYYSLHMSIVAQALALRALSENGWAELSRADLHRYQERLHVGGVMALASFMSAAASLNAVSEASEAWSALLNRVKRTESKVVFEEASRPGARRVLASTTKSNCAVLSALSNSLHQGLGFGSEKELDGIAIGVREAMSMDELNTHDSAMCLLALADYASLRESEEPDFTVRSTLLTSESGLVALGEKMFQRFVDAPFEAAVPVVVGLEGATGSLKLRASGTGVAHFGAELSFVPISTDDRALSAGIRVVRQYAVQDGEAWRLQGSEVKMSRGDRVRTDLYIELPATRYFVVVDDPVPGGIEPLNQELRTTFLPLESSDGIDNDPNSYANRSPYWEPFHSEGIGFYHREIGHSNVVFHSESLPKGRYRLTWYGQAVATGSFQAKQTRAEEMYSPEVHGRSESARVTVVASSE